MIRKSIVVVLTLGAIGTGVLWALGLMVPVRNWGYTGDWFAIGVTKTGLYLVELRGFPDDDLSFLLKDNDFMILWRQSLDTPRVVALKRIASCGFVLSKSNPKTGSLGRPILTEVQWVVRGRLWVLLLLFAAYPLIRLVTYLRHRDGHTDGCCSKCGYDLTGNVSGVCPECGTKIEKP